MATMEQRVARLESAYEHLATKEDLANVGADLRAEMATKADVAELREGQRDTNGRIDRLFLAVLGIGGVLGAAAISGVVVLGVALLG